MPCSSSNQVEVLTDVDGGSKVIARGKLKSVRTHRASSSSSVSSTHQFQKAQSSSSAIDSTSRRAAYNNKAVENSKTVNREKQSWKIPWYAYVLFLLLLVLLVIYLRYRKQINSSVSKFFQSNQSNMKILLLIAATYFLSGCSNTPDNNVKGIKIEHTGYKPGASVNNRAVEVSDTQVLLSPTWGQARHFASKRGDHWIWVLIQFVLVAAFFIVLYGQIRDAAWLPQQLSGTWLLFVLGALFLASNWQSAAVKWENDVYVPKAQYDRAIENSGSTRPIWDSLENGCHIIWGPYGCYQ